jgi:hypothetical protein
MNYLVALTALLISQHSYAYLDPGTGSYLLQIIVGAFAGGLFLIKTYWGNLKTYFGAKKANKQVEQNDGN